jgi:CheY-like chemotaxis protein
MEATCTSLPDGFARILRHNVLSNDHFISSRICQQGHAMDGCETSRTSTGIKNTSTSRSKASQPRILLVEDDIGTLLVMNRLLTQLGYQVQSADSVAGALAVANDYPIDLVLSDVNLPDGTGYQLMDELRNRYSAIGIAITGYSDLEDLDRSSRAGFATHLVKPIDFDTLKALISLLLSR